MAVFHFTLTVPTRGSGLIEISDLIADQLAQCQIRQGIVSIFCQHTSCSLVIMENADPTARSDLVAWLDRLVPENDPHFRHTLEGGDDMPAHIKMALTRTSESVPLVDGRMALGTWQGVYLWEHRRSAHRRKLIVTVLGE